MLQSFYRGGALTRVLGTTVTIGYLAQVDTPPHLDAATWGVVLGASIATAVALLLWLQRLDLAAYERREFGQLPPRRTRRHRTVVEPDLDDSET